MNRFFTPSGHPRRGVLGGLVCLICFVVLLLSFTPGFSGEFRFAKGVFVTGVKGHSNYTERQSSDFRKKELAMVYLEVDGFENKQEGITYRLDLSLDLLVKDDQGTVGVEQKGVVVSKNIMETPLQSMYFTVTIDPSQLRPGRYTLCFIATDHYSGRKAVQDLTMKIK